MVLDYDSFWFIVSMITAMVFISIAIIFFGIIVANGEEIESYKDCIQQNIPPEICNALYPPITLQNVNWTLIPFP